MDKEEGLSSEKVAIRLRERFESQFKSLDIKGNVVLGAIDGKHILSICECLKNLLSFDYLSCISAVDKKDVYEVVYHIASYPNKLMIQINAEVPKENPSIRSVSHLWYGANYHEREAFDMMGIVFEGHPNLKRILLPDDFEGHPLRKDFKLSYREG
jgi:NADH-quinone oxidoreductase subunit C